MKKYLLPLIALVLCLFSCNQQSQVDEQITLSESNIEASTEGGTYSVSVVCPGHWSASVESDADWISLNPTQGDGNTDVAITTKAGSDFAIAYVTFTYKGQNANLTIVRHKYGYSDDGAIEIDIHSIAAPAIGGNYEISVSSGVKWIVDSNVSWVTVNQGVGNKNGTISVKVAPADNFVETTGEIAIYEMGKSKASGAVVSVVREGIHVADFAVGYTKVIFAPGNLQYNRFQNIFRIAEHQYDYIGVDNERINDISYSGWIDLFGWGTSGYNNKYPYLSSTETEDYYGDSNIANTDYDWGQYNAISHDFYKDTDKGFWRTPTRRECSDLIDNYDMIVLRIKEIAKSTDDAGAVFLPNDILIPEDLEISHIQINECTLEQFNYLQAQGAVYLPRLSGMRSGTVFRDLDNDNAYWTSSISRENRKAYVYTSVFGITDMSIRDYYLYTGFSVRLVHDVK